eukprot:368149_1
MQRMHHLKSTKLSLNERLTSIGIRYWTLVCLLASIDILGPLATDAYLPSLPYMTKDLNTSPSWIQFTILSYSFIMALSSLFGGLLSDKYGRRNMTLFGLFIFICGGFGCTFSPNIWILNICRFIQGIGGGISSIITSSVARDVFLANERMKILGILGSIRPIGIVIAPMIGGWISGLYGWRMVFFITTSFALIVMILSSSLLPETKNKFFVNYSKIHNLQTETNILGNIECDDSIPSKVLVDDDDDDSEDDEWCPAIALQPISTCDKLSDTEASLLPSTVTKNGTYDELLPTNRNSGDFKRFYLWKTVCSDNVLMSVSWMYVIYDCLYCTYVTVLYIYSIGLRMVGVFVFLNEFPYALQQISNESYGQQISGLMLGFGSIFTILGASVAILIDRNTPSQISERSSLLFLLSPNNSKLSIMRLASIASLVSCMLLILPPILIHYNTFTHVLNINSHMNHLQMILFMYTDNPWYFLVIPFCVLTFSQGLFIPPASVVVLEPYPHIAASITAVLQFWRVILPTLTLIVITQCLSYSTDYAASIVIHGIVGLCAFLCFVLMYGCVSGHEVRLRMSGWQERMRKRGLSDSQSTSYGSNDQTCTDIGIKVARKSGGVCVDVSSSMPTLMDISTFSMYTRNVMPVNAINAVYDQNLFYNANHVIIKNNVTTQVQELFPPSSAPTMQF